MSASASARLSSGELAAAVMRKCRESMATKERFFSEESARIVECAGRMAEAFDRGARLLVMGNGGSSCDAAHVSVEFMHPIIEKRPALPAMALTTDTALLTAVGNDQDFSMAFLDQLRMLGRAGDMALGISTSGKSANINRAMQSAKELGMLTVGFSGRDGGRLPAICDFCFTVPSFSIHRIQESHETLLHILWDLIHVIRGEEDVI
jgi:D-sedoheptulose 7-phosphate isomerase